MSNRNPLFIATVAAALTVGACSTANAPEPVGPAPAVEATSTEPAAATGPVDATIGQPFHTVDSYGAGPVEVLATEITTNHQCTSGPDMIQPEPGQTFLTISGQLAAGQAPGTVYAPERTFFDTDGYALSGSVTHCDQPDNTEHWTAVTVDPGDKARVSTTYRITGEPAEVRIGNHSFTGDQITHTTESR